MLLAARGARAAVPELMRLARGPEPYRAAAAVTALGRLAAQASSDEAARRAVQDARGHPSVIVRRAAQAALADLGTGGDGYHRGGDEARPSRRATTHGVDR
jgi:HEAT repeat protein